MKKSLSLLSTLLLMLLCACNITSDTSGVSNNQLIEDISTNDAFVKNFSSKFVDEQDFRYVEHSIEKRQTNIEKKEEIIHCTVKMENDYFSTIMSVIITYGYYDVGGWSIDNVEVVEKNTVPISAISVDAFYGEMIDCLSLDSSSRNWYERIVYTSEEEYYNRTAGWIHDSTVTSAEDFEIVDCSFFSGEYSPEEGHGSLTYYTSNVHVKIQSSLSVIEGKIVLIFDPQKGWRWAMEQAGLSGEKNYPMVFLENVQFGSYKEALGKFICETPEYMSLSLNRKIVEFEILSVDPNDNTLTYKDWYGREWKTEFDPVLGNFYIKDRFHNGMNMYYDSNRETWFSPYDYCTKQ